MVHKRTTHSWTNAVKKYLVGGLALALFQTGNVRALQALLSLNVIVMAVPPTVNKNYLLTAIVASLALLTPKDIYASRSYVLAHACVFVTYYLLSQPFRNNQLKALVTILPMAFVTLDPERAWVYRLVGILVYMSIPTWWTLQSQYPPTRFRPVETPTNWTRLATALQEWTRHPATKGALYTASTLSLLGAMRERFM